MHLHVHVHVHALYLFIVLCVGESKASLVLYLSYSMVYMRHVLYSMARDNGVVLAFLTAGNKMQSTINHGKGRAVSAKKVWVWSR